MALRIGIDANEIQVTRLAAQFRHQAADEHIPKQVLGSISLVRFSIALTVAAIVVIGFRDRETFVSPPEQVGEGFVRRLVSKRYDRAIDQVSKGSGITAERLEQLSRALMERAGNVADVSGEPGAIRGDEAEATAVVRPVGRKEIPVRLQLKLENSEWLISRIPQL